MALTTFGPALDLHAGGADLVFPHHAYESAQAEAVTNVRPFARAWLRAGVVRVDGAKMSKSTGNLVLVEQLAKAHRPGAVRLLLLSRRWWEAWDYTRDDLDAAEQRLDELLSAAGHSRASSLETAAVLAALCDDLDVPTTLDIAVEAGGDAARLAVDALGVAQS